MSKKLIDKIHFGTSDVYFWLNDGYIEVDILGVWLNQDYTYKLIEQEATEYANWLWKFIIEEEKE